MAATRQTTFLIPNLHCPTCTTHIEEALYGLDLPPTSVSTSIISHTVVVKHPSALSADAIAKTLEETGFEVFDVLEGSEQKPSGRRFAKGDDAEHGIPSFAFEQALSKWRMHDVELQDSKKLKHVENCHLCKSQYASRLLGKDGTQGSEKGKDLSFVVAESSLCAALPTQATLAIEGMTCSSCVGSVTKALEELPYVQSANVSLLTHSVTIKFFGEHRANDLVEAVEDAGFGASLDAVDVCEPDYRPKVDSGPDLWKATFAVEGMTCSSCVGSLTNALKEQSWAIEVEVSLMTHSAVVLFEGKGRVEDIQKIIDDLGYDASLDSVVDLATEKLASVRRVVSIRITGMYCDHCPLRLEETIKSLGPVSLEKVPTITDPIMRLSYIPHPPSLTIRTILDSLNDADDQFECDVYHPMTLEERSRRMQVREQKHMTYRLILSVAAAIPSFIIGIVYMALVSDSDPGRRYLSQRLHGVSRTEWALFITATPVYFFAADVFHRRTLKELRALWRPGSSTPILNRFYKFGSMNMLISFGTTIAYFASIAEVVLLATSGKGAHMGTSNTTYFDSVVFLTMFLLIGRLIEAYSKAKAGDAVAELGKLRPKEALLVCDEKSTSNEKLQPTKLVALDQLEIGDIVRVPHGSSPPFDGIIVKGESTFDESSLTGESKPVTKETGDEVFSGTINNGVLVSVRINGVSETSMLDQIIKVVREGLAKRAPVERVADVLTGYFVPAITLIAISTWIIWMALGLSGSLPDDFLDTDRGGWPFWALEFAIAVFVVACPCGIGLAAPTALFVGGGLAAKYGILAKGGGQAFQEASNLDCIVFDKTGTLTQGGDPKVSDHLIIRTDSESLDDATVLGVVHGLESESTHSIAKALVRFCDHEHTNNMTINNVVEVAGKGMRGQFEIAKGNKIEARLGNESLMYDFEVTIPPEVPEALDAWKTSGKSVALLALKNDFGSGDWKLSAAFAISDPLRPEAASVVKALQNRGIDIWMISGDNPVTANAIGEQVGIARDHIIAGVLPSQKSEQIKYLQRSSSHKNGRADSGTETKAQSTTKRATVAMVGDGINDSPALATADVGIAIGSGSDVAISTAEFVLVTSQLTALLVLIDLSRAVFRRIKLNFGWALVYNCLAVPVAAGVLYPLTTQGSREHIRLDPVWAALAMALSSISVVCSSLLLRTRLPLVGFRPAEEVRT